METDRRGFLAALIVAPFVPKAITPFANGLRGIVDYQPLDMNIYGIPPKLTEAIAIRWCKAMQYERSRSWLVPHQSKLYYTPERERS